MNGSSAITQQTTSPLQVLAACLSVSGQSDAQLGRLIAATGAADWRQTLKLAGSHLVTPTLAWALESRGLAAHLGEEEREYLDTIRLLNRERNDVLRGELMRVVAALNDIGVTPLLLKGAISLALPNHYPGAADRVVGDLDIVVDPGRARDAQSRIAELDYTEAFYGREWTTREERDILHHHLSPMTHDTLPVCVEVHTRIVSDRRDDDALAAWMRTTPWVTPAGGRALIPDPVTRVAHNFIHSHLSHGLGARRLFNLRHLHEFASLVSHHQSTLTADDVCAALSVRGQRSLAVYWALAQRWLGAPLPPDLARSGREGRELWLVERVMQRPAWRRGFDAIDAVSGLPVRLRLHLRRFRELPGYSREFGRRVRRRLLAKPSDDET